MVNENPPTTPLSAAPLTSLSGVELKRLFSASTAWLEKHAPFVNSLNVFPVPDGDSGTNMLLTMQAAMREVERAPVHSAGEFCAALARGALLGARGNSGVILSQIIRGLAHRVDKRAAITVTDLAEGLLEGAQTAYKGVVKPVEGTILTVAREAAQSANMAAQQSNDLRLVMHQTLQGARLALQNTPNLLPVLKEAGVVDAGGQGLVVILEGAYKYLVGEPMEMAAPGVSAEKLARLSSEEGWGYDIQFHIRGNGLEVDRIRETISGMGESALIVGDENLIKVHVHAPNPGDILKFGAEQGALVNILIENMQEQYQEFMAGGATDPRASIQDLGSVAPLPTLTTDPPRIAIIAVATGSGLKNVFESLGAAAIVNGGQSNNPSIQDILQAIEQCKSDQVIVLPNNKNIILASTQAKELTRKSVAVVPTRTIPQGIGALLAFNFQNDLESNAQAMERAAQRVRTLEVTEATRTVTLDGVEVRQGQAIGIVDGELAGAGDNRLQLVLDLLQRMSAAESEILTVYYGEPVTPAEVRTLTDRLSEVFPRQAVEMHPGNQPLYHYIISVE